MSDVKVYLSFDVNKNIEKSKKNIASIFDSYKKNAESSGNKALVKEIERVQQSLERTISDAQAKFASGVVSGFDEGKYNKTISSITSRLDGVEKKLLTLQERFDSSDGSAYLDRIRESLEGIGSIIKTNADEAARLKKIFGSAGISNIFGEFSELSRAREEATELYELHKELKNASMYDPSRNNSKKLIADLSSYKEQVSTISNLIDITKKNSETLDIQSEAYKRSQNELTKLRAEQDLFINRILKISDVLSGRGVDFSSIYTSGQILNMSDFYEKNGKKRFNEFETYRSSVDSYIAKLQEAENKSHATVNNVSNNVAKLSAESIKIPIGFDGSSYSLLNKFNEITDPIYKKAYQQPIKLNIDFVPSKKVLTMKAAAEELNDNSNPMDMFSNIKSHINDAVNIAKTSVSQIQKLLNQTPIKIYPKIDFSQEELDSVSKLLQGIVDGKDFNISKGFKEAYTKINETLKLLSSFCAENKLGVMLDGFSDKINTELTNTNTSITNWSSGVIGEAKKIESSFSSLNKMLSRISDQVVALNKSSKIVMKIDGMDDINSQMQMFSELINVISGSNSNNIVDALYQRYGSIRKLASPSSDLDIDSQWKVVEDKMNWLTRKDGELNKTRIKYIRELIVEYQKYLDMGGNKGIKDLSSKDSVRQAINADYNEYKKSLVTNIPIFEGQTEQLIGFFEKLDRAFEDSARKIETVSKREVASLQEIINKINNELLPLLDRLKEIKPIDIKLESGKNNFLESLNKLNVEEINQLSSHLKSIADSIRIISESENAKSVLSSFKVGEKSIGNISQLPSILSQIKSNLDGLSSDGFKFLSSLSDITKNAEALKTLAASAGKIKSTTNASDETLMRDSYSIILANLKKIISYQNQIKQTRDPNTIKQLEAEIVLLQKEVDQRKAVLKAHNLSNDVKENEVKNTEREIAVINNLIKAKEEERQARANTLKQDVKAQSEMLQKDSSGWKTALDVLKSYKKELKSYGIVLDDISKITRNVNVNEATGFKEISYAFTDIKGNYGVVGANGKLLIRQDEVVNLSKSYDTLEKSIKSYYSLLERVVKSGLTPSLRNELSDLESQILSIDGRLNSDKKLGFVLTDREKQISNLRRAEFDSFIQYASESYSGLLSKFQELSSIKGGSKDFNSGMADAFQQLDALHVLIQNIQQQKDKINLFDVDELNKAIDSTKTLINSLSGAKSLASEYRTQNTRGTIIDANDINGIKDYLQSLKDMSSYELQVANNGMRVVASVKSQNGEMSKYVFTTKQIGDNYRVLKSDATSLSSLYSDLTKNIDGYYSALGKILAGGKNDALDLSAKEYKRNILEIEALIKSLSGKSSGVDYFGDATKIESEKIKVLQGNINDLFMSAKRGITELESYKGLATDEYSKELQSAIDMLAEIQSIKTNVDNKNAIKIVDVSDISFWLSEISKVIEKLKEIRNYSSKYRAENVSGSVINATDESGVRGYLDNLQDIESYELRVLNNGKRIVADAKTSLGELKRFVFTTKEIGQQFRVIRSDVKSEEAIVKKDYDDLSSAVSNFYKVLTDILISDDSPKLDSLLNKHLEAVRTITERINGKIDAKIIDGEKISGNILNFDEVRQFEHIIGGLVGDLKTAAHPLLSMTDMTSDFNTQIISVSNKLVRLDELKARIFSDGYIFNKKDVVEINSLLTSTSEIIKKISSATKPSSEYRINNNRGTLLPNVTNEGDIKSYIQNLGYVKDYTLGIMNDGYKIVANVRTQTGETQKLVFTTKELGTSYRVMTSSVESQTSTWKRLGGVIKQSLRYLTYYMSGYMLAMRVVSAIRNGVSAIKDLNKQLTEMRKVSNSSFGALKRYADGAHETAVSLGAATSNLLSSTADWMRVGKSLEDASKLANDSILLFNVSEFEEINEATDALIAMTQAYQELGSTEIIDKLNNIGNNFSISTSDLAGSLQRSAAALKVAGNDINEAIALTVAGNSILQNPESVAAGVRTISLRITGTKEAKDELESMGEDVDDFVVTTKSKMEESIRRLTAVASNSFKGISILDDNGNYKSTYQVLQEVADIWKEMADLDKQTGDNRTNALLELMAGKIRSNVLASILNDAELLRDVYESSQDSAGSAMREQERYLDSIEGRTNQLTAQVQEFWHTLIDDDAVKNFTLILKEIVDSITFIVDKVHTIPSIAGVLAGILSMKNIGFITSGFAGNSFAERYGVGNRSYKQIGADMKSNGWIPGLFNMRGRQSALSPAELLKNTTFTSIDTYFDAANEAIAGGTNSLNTFISTSKTADTMLKNHLYDSLKNGSEASFSGYVSYVEQASFATSGFSKAIRSIGTMAVNMLGTMAVMYVVNRVITSIIDNTKQAEHAAETAEDFTERIQNSSKNISKSKETLSSLQKEYWDLSEGVDNLGRNVSLSSDEYDRYLDIVSQISDIMPNLNTYYDEQGRKIGFVAGQISNLNAEYEKQLQNEAKAFMVEKDEHKKNSYQQTMDNFFKYKSDEANHRIEQINDILSMSDDVLSELDYVPWYENLWSAFQGKPGEHYFSNGQIGVESFLYSILGLPKDFDTSNVNGLKEYLVDYINSFESEAFVAAQNVINAMSMYLKSTDQFWELSSDDRNIASTIISSMSTDLLESMGEQFGDDTKAFVRQLLSSFDNAGFSQSWNNLFTIDESALNVSDYLEYVSGNIQTVCDSLGLTKDGDRYKMALALGFDYDETQILMDAFASKLSSQYHGHDPFERLSVEDIKIVVNKLKIPRGTIRSWGDLISKIDDYKKSLAATKAIEDLDKVITNTTENLSKLSDSLKGAFSDTGISKDGIEEIKKVFKDIKNIDYDAMFEETPLGVRINVDELYKNVEALKDLGALEFHKNVEALKKEYADLDKRIAKCATAEERYALMQKKMEIKNQIESANLLASAYDSATSAFSMWKLIQESGSYGDTYDEIKSSLEEIEKLYQTGNVGDTKFKGFLQLMAGANRELKTTEDYVKFYEELAGKDGWLTTWFGNEKDTTNVNNFLDDLSKNDLIKELSDGTKVLDLDEIAEKFGVSIDYIQVMIDKARNMGLEIEITGKVDEKSVEELQEKLKETGVLEDKYEINIAVSNAEDAQKEIDKISSIIGEVREKAESNEEFEILLGLLQEQYLILQKKKAEFANQLPEFMSADTQNYNKEASEAYNALQNLYNAYSEYKIMLEDSSIYTEEQINKQKKLIDDLALSYSGIDGSAIGVDFGLLNTENIESFFDGVKTSFNDTKANMEGDPIKTGVELEFVNYDEIKRKLDELKEDIKIKVNFDASNQPTIKPASTHTSPNGGGGANRTPRDSRVDMYQFSGTVNGFSSGTDVSIQSDQTALVNELGNEGIVRDGVLHEIKGGAQLKKLKRGDIIFNHKQMEQLRKNGYVTANGGRGKVVGYSSGTVNGISAFVGDYSASGKIEHVSQNKQTALGAALDVLESSASSVSSAAKSAEDLFDWIEIKLNRIARDTEMATNAIDRAVGLMAKQEATLEAIAKTQTEADVNRQAYERYLAQANGVALSENLKKQVREGSIEISNYDEDTQKKIEDYKNWYDAALESYDKLFELEDSLAELVQRRLDNISEFYDLIVNIKSEIVSVTEARRELNTALGVAIDNPDNINQLNNAVKAQSESYENLVNKLNMYQEEFNSLVANGWIKEGSTAYYEGQAQIQAFTAEVYAANKELIDMQDSLRQIEYDKIQYIIDGLTRVVEKIDSKISLIEARDEEVPESYYTDQIDINNQQIEQLYEMRQKYLEEQALYDVGSERYTELAEEIANADSNIYDLLVSNEELKDSIFELRFAKLDKLVEQYANLRSELESFSDLIDEGSMFDKSGAMTDSGLASIALIQQQIGIAKQEIADYRVGLEKLQEAYDNGLISLEEYEEKSEEYRSGLQNAVKDVKGYEDALTDLYVKQMSLENDALKESIDKYKEALRRKAEYFDYDKTLKSKQKSVDLLKAQIAALEGVNNATARAQLKRLQQDLRDAQEDLDDTKRDHERDIMEQGYDELADRMDKVLEDTEYAIKHNADFQQQVISEMLGNVVNMYETAYGRINEIIASTGWVGSDGFNSGQNGESASRQVEDALRPTPDTTGSGTAGGISTGGVGTHNPAIESEIGKQVDTANRKVAELKLSPTSITLDEGKSCKITASIRPNDAANKSLHWNTTNNGVATVSNGTVHAVAGGSCIITATTTDGSGLSATVGITVIAKPVETPAPTPSQPSQPSQPSPGSGSSGNSGGDGVPRVGDLVTFTSGRYYYDSYGTGPSGNKYLGGQVYITKISKNGTKPYHISTGKTLGQGDLGWLTLDQLKGYESGTYGVKSNQFAWTNENGAEMIVRKSDGAILTKLNVGDGVIPANLTKNLFSWGAIKPDALLKPLSDVVEKISSGIIQPIKQEYVIQNSYGSLLTVNGNVDRETLPELKEILKKSYEYTTQNLYKDARKLGLKK